MSSSTPVIFRVDTATYDNYCYDLSIIYIQYHCFRYLKSEENRTSINFVLHLSAVVLMHGSRVKVPQKSTLHFKYVEMSRRSRHRTTTLWVVKKIKTITKKNPISTIPVEDHEIHNYSSEEANEDSDPEWFVACLVPATVMRFQFAVQSTNGQPEDPCTGWLEVLNGYNYQLSQ